MVEQTPATEQSRIYRRRWWTLAVLSLSVLIVAIEISRLNVALPTLQRELDTSGAELQWIVNAYILALAAFLLTMGSLGDRLGRAPALRAGLFIIAAASLGAMFSRSAFQLIAARAVIGVGAALIMPATLAIITNVFPREERGKAIGAWAAMSGVGIALGPILGGLLIEYFHWGTIFLINVPVVAVALIAGWFLVPNSRDPHPRRLDIPGTILSASALSLLVFGLIKAGDWGWADPMVDAILAGAVVAVILFIAWERHTATPMLDIGLFRHPRFSAGAGSITLLMLGQFGMIFGLILYMQFVLGYSALETGIRFLPIALGWSIGASVSHRLVTNFGTTRVIASGFLGFTVMVVFASFWQIDTSYLVLGLILFFWGFFSGNIMVSAVDSVLGAVPQARAGVGSAMHGTSVQVGGAIGVASLGSVLSSVYSSSVTPAIAAIPDLPMELADTARDSVGAAVIAASTLPEGAGDALALAARESFMDAWQVMALVVCGIGVVTIGFVLRFMPPRHLPEEEVGELTA